MVKFSNHRKFFVKNFIKDFLWDYIFFIEISYQETLSKIFLSWMVEGTENL